MVSMTSCAVSIINTTFKPRHEKVRQHGSMLSGYFFISQEMFKEKQDIKNEAREISKISTTSYPGLLRLLLSESNKRRSPGYEVEISIKIILVMRLR
jgi:hypothetical protein